MSYLEPMDHDGCLIGSYEGDGLITTANSTTHICRFNVEHHVELGVRLVCYFKDSCPIFDLEDWSFSGTTIDGIYSLRSIGRIHVVKSQPTHDSERRALCLLHGLSVNRIEPLTPNTVRYGISNFTFTGTEVSTDSKDADGIFPGRLELPLTLSDGIVETHVTIVPHDSYDELSSQIGLYATARVTCECASTITDLFPAKPIDKTISSLCNLLSIARGTRIVWTYRSIYSGNGQLTERLHLSSRPGRYTALSIFDDLPRHSHDLKRFIETAYPIYCERNQDFELGRNLIESYLSAKAEDDLLERRGAKLAITLEILKKTYLKKTDSISEYILSKNRFDKLAKNHIRPAIKAVLTANNIDESSCDALCEKINELNRTSFRTILNSLFNSINFHPDEAEITLFVKQRNSLVHDGSFYNDAYNYKEFLYFSPSTSSEHPQGGDLGRASYFFMINFIDRLFLKFFNYSGPYINRKIKSQQIQLISHLDEVK